MDAETPAVFATAFKPMCPMSFASQTLGVYRVEQAMAEFRDAPGRPGPGAWQFGTYPEARVIFP